MDNSLLNVTDYKDLSLSAIRANLSYLSYDDIKNYYNNKENINKNDLLYSIFNDMKGLPKYYSNLNDSVVAYTWIENDTLHIMFRGTNNLKDVIIDATICRTKLFPDDNSILVHRGFLAYFMLLERDLGNEIMKQINNNNINKIQFNSHSLGAAAATIAVCWFRKIFQNIKIINHTFGSPRVGNKEFVKLYQQSVDINVRIRNNKDPVPLIPISILYYHVDDCICINQKCIPKSQNKDDNWFVRLIKLPFQIYYRSPGYYHHCDIYINNLLQIYNKDDYSKFQ
jgi:hypothetical protein